VPGTHGSEGQAPASEGPGSGERPEREAPSAEFAEPRGRPRRARRRRFSWRTPAASLLIILGCILAPLSVLGVWTANQVSDTSRYVGLGIEGEEGAEAGAIAGAEEAAAEGINVFGDAEEWDVLEDIPNDSAAALILIEHHWAVPLRDAIARAGGFRLGDGFISPLDLVEIGLMSADEAKELHAMETSAAAKA